jgi:hypothetical protein
MACIFDGRPSEPLDRVADPNHHLKEYLDRRPKNISGGRVLVGLTELNSDPDRIWVGRRGLAESALGIEPSDRTTGPAPFTWMIRHSKLTTRPTDCLVHVAGNERLDRPDVNGAESMHHSQASSVEILYTSGEARPNSIIIPGYAVRLHGLRVTVPPAESGLRPYPQGRASR